MGQRVNRKVRELTEYQHLSHLQEAMQLSRGNLEIDIGFIEFDDIVITRECSNVPLTVQPQDSSSLHRVFVPGVSGMQRRWNGNLIPTDSAISIPNWDGIFCNTPNQYDIELTFSDELAKNMGFNNPTQASVIPLKSMEQLSSWVATLLATRKPTVQLRKEIIDTLSKVFASTDSSMPTIIEAHKRFALIQRALSHLAKVDADLMYLSAKELCDELGTTQKTLQRAFNDVLDVSPYQYLMCVRLQSAHRWMKEHARITSVTEVGARFGFTSTSAFIKHYQSFYGETPAVALRRFKA